MIQSATVAKQQSGSPRGLRAVTVAAMILIQLASLKAHWSDVAQGRPDFAALYTSAAAIHAGENPNYNPADVKGVEGYIDPGAGSSPNVPLFKSDMLHPPFESLLFLPLTLLSYKTAYLVWYACNLALFWSVPLMLWPFIQRLHADFHFIAILIGSMLPVSICLVFGQDSILLLVLLSAAYIRLERSHETLAGFFLGLGLFKFQVVIPIIAIFLLIRAWKIMAGFFYALAILLVTSCAAIGTRQTLSYFAFIFAFGRHISGNISVRTALMPNLRGLVSLCIGTLTSPRTQTLIVLAISAIVFCIVLRWNLGNPSAPPRIRFSVLVTMSSIVSYYYYIHNAVILILPLLLLANELAGPSVNRRLQLIFAVTAVTMYIVPVLFPLGVGVPALSLGSLALLALPLLHDSQHAARRT